MMWTTLAENRLTPKRETNSSNEDQEESNLSSQMLDQTMTKILYPALDA